MSYVAHGNEVHYLHPDDHTEELFITVHPTKDCTKTTSEQAELLATMMNALIEEKSLTQILVKIDV